MPIFVSNLAPISPSPHPKGRETAFSFPLELSSSLGKERRRRRQLLHHSLSPQKGFARNQQKRVCEQEICSSLALLSLPFVKVSALKRRATILALLLEKLNLNTHFSLSSCLGPLLLLLGSRRIFSQDEESTHSSFSFLLLSSFSTCKLPGFCALFFFVFLSLSQTRTPNSHLYSKVPLFFLLILSFSLFSSCHIVLFWLRS